MKRKKSSILTIFLLLLFLPYGRSSSAKAPHADADAHTIYMYLQRSNCDRKIGLDDYPYFYSIINDSRDLKTVRVLLEQKHMSGPSYRKLYLTRILHLSVRWLQKDRGIDTTVVDNSLGAAFGFETGFDKAWQPKSEVVFRTLDAPLP
jgi:hypothetical protein